MNEQIIAKGYYWKYFEELDESLKHNSIFNFLWHLIFLFAPTEYHYAYNGIRKREYFKLINLKTRKKRKIQI